MRKEIAGFHIEIGDKRFYLLADSKEDAKIETMKVLGFNIPQNVLWTNSKERLIWDGMTVVRFKLIDVRRR